MHGSRAEDGRSGRGRQPVRAWERVAAVGCLIIGAIAFHRPLRDSGRTPRAHRRAWPGRGLPSWPDRGAPRLPPWCIPCPPAVRRALSRARAGRRGAAGSARERRHAACFSRRASGCRRRHALGSIRILRAGRRTNCMPSRSGSSERHHRFKRDDSKLGGTVGVHHRRCDQRIDHPHLLHRRRSGFGRSCEADVAARQDLRDRV